MNILPGQRYRSDMEPELGMGRVVSVAGKRFSILFPLAGEERMYSTVEAPVHRIIFNPGDTIHDASGQAHIVCARHEAGGLCIYDCGTVTIPEAELAAVGGFTGPMDRFARGIMDDPAAFDFRCEAQRVKSRSIASEVRGFAGARIELIPHQFSIASAVSSSAVMRCFLADEVGLGKTIEACLILHRLLLTGQINRALIVVPQYLMHQWFVELYRRFNLLAGLCNDDFKTADFEGPHNPFERGNLYIVSMDDLSGDSPLRQALIDAPWDLLIVDEAHHLSAGSEAYAATHSLAVKTAGLLLLSASPEVLDDESFFALSRLLDPVKYRSREQFAEERERYEETVAVADRLLSGTALSRADIAYLQSRLPRTAAGLVAGAAAGAEAAGNIARRLIDIGGIGRSMFRNTRKALGGFPTRCGTILALPVAGDTAPAMRPDKIDEVVLNWISGHLLADTDKKSLVIVDSKEKALALQKHLAAWPAIRVALFHEDMTLVTLDRNAAWFSEAEGASVLVSSEIGSEGRNFQFADWLILADLPMEPEKLEQRIGRLDRIGRKKTVEVLIPVVENRYEHILAQWYDRGLHAFDHTVPGAHRIGRKFGKALAACAQSSAPDRSETLETIIAETASYAADMSERMEKGRNRLLELVSFNRAEGERLGALVAASDADSRFSEFMEKVFDYFGVSSEALAAKRLRIGFDLLIDHAFPVPHLKQDGMVLTYDRATALAREDYDFLSPDHPMVQGALDLILAAEKGNCSYALWEHAGKSDMLLETLYILECPGSGGSPADRYLPRLPLRIVINGSGEDVSAAFPAKVVSMQLRNSSSQERIQIASLAEGFVGTMTEHSREIAEEKQTQFIAEAMQKIMKDHAAEKSRTAEFGDTNPDIQRQMQHTEALFETCRQRVASAQLRLDAVRLVRLTP